MVIKQRHNQPNALLFLVNNRLALYFIMLVGTINFVSCSQNYQTESNSGTNYRLENFNDLSTFFVLDSIQHKNKSLVVYFTDTSKFYQPTRHVQNYMLSFLTVIEPFEISKNNDTIEFKVRMPFRQDGDINISYPTKKLLPILKRFETPIVKRKIIVLNKFNKAVYTSKSGDKNLDVLYKLNMYFAQIVDPSSWVGVDSYTIVWEYEYNKAGGHKLSEHRDAFNGILTDTLYMKDRSVGREIHGILFGQ